MRRLFFLLLLATTVSAQTYDSGGNLNVDPRRWGNVTMTAAATMADNFANPIAPPIASFGMVWDGATWDRWTGAVTVSDGSGALNVIVDSGTLTAVTTITNPVTVTDGAGALNTIVDSGTLTAVTEITNALPAGNNNIGDVDVASIAAGNNNIGDVDVASIAAGTNYIGKTRITDGTLDTTLVDETGSSAVDVLGVGGGTPNDSVDSGNPIKVGGKAFSFGTGPTAVAANDRTNASYTRDGVAWVINGSPTSTNVEYLWTTAQTNDALVTVSSGTRICVTAAQMTLDEATTVGVGVRCGFGTSTLPTAPTDGNTATGIFLTHLGVVPGSGINTPPGTLVCGADDEDIRCTTEATTGGTGKLLIYYFTTAN